MMLEDVRGFFSESGLFLTDDGCIYTARITAVH